MKIILAGTPTFSVPTFEKIIENFDVVGIISQPNKPVGRMQTISITPTKMLGDKYKIPVYQPNKISEIFDELKNIEFDLLITMAYGQIINEGILSLSRLGSYNIHASLLPKYRGAAPIQYCLLNGDKETGITFMEMIKKMDAGDIIFQQKLQIEDDDDQESLMHKLSNLSAQYIVDWIKNIELGQFKKIKQNESEVVFSPKIQPEDEQLKFDTVENTLNKIRALNPIPGAYFKDSNKLNKRVKVFKAIKENNIKNAIEIPCKDGKLFGVVYQVEGKNKVKLVNNED